MGCNVSRLDGNGATLPARLRPIFLQRLEEIKARRHTAGRPLRDHSTPSKKGLLSHYDIEDMNASSHHHSPKSPSKIMPMYSVQYTINQKPNQQSKQDELKIEDQMMMVKERKCNKNDHERKEIPTEDAKAKFKDALTDADEDDQDTDDDDDDDDERMIGYEDDDVFPGSPSFRIFFEENDEENHNDIIGKIEVFKEINSSDDGIPPKEPSMEKKVKKGRKKRSFRKVLPKGGQVAVKNLLNVKSCYKSSSSSHYQPQFLTGKTTI